MNDLVQKLKEHVIELSNNNKNFIHHSWYVKYHLAIVEKIAIELCDNYKNADKDTVIAMVWMHDYGKIIDIQNQYTSTLLAGRDKLIEMGFPLDFTEKIIDNIRILDKKENLASNIIPIEIKIVSSADGAAHLVGPFYYMWWYENSHKPFEELMADNIKKLQKDWEKKIVLPEVIKAFEGRRDHLLEQTGLIPDAFLTK